MKYKPKCVGPNLFTARTCVAKDNMAKSIRSKRKRKLRAERREKLKPKVKAKLEEILGLKDNEMVVEAESCEGDKSEETQEDSLENQEATTVNETGTKTSHFVHWGLFAL